MENSAAQQFNDEGNIVLHWINSAGKERKSVLTPESYISCEQVDALLGWSKGTARHARFYGKLEFPEYPIGKTSSVRYKLKDILSLKPLKKDGSSPKKGAL